MHNNSTELGEDFLAHYGIKGMHWGIRNPSGTKLLVGIKKQPYTPARKAKAIALGAAFIPIGVGLAVPTSGLSLLGLAAIGAAGTAVRLRYFGDVVINSPIN